VVRVKGVELLRDTIPTTPPGAANAGTIDEVFARAVEKDFAAALERTLVEPGDADAVSVSVDRTVNILAGAPFTLSERVQPHGYAEQVVQTLAFSNPFGT
jgi:hypothetical protein